MMTLLMARKHICYKMSVSVVVFFLKLIYKRLVVLRNPLTVHSSVQLSYLVDFIFLCHFTG